ncbi:unnamed protein product [Lampetra fluviatilis]
MRSSNGETKQFGGAGVGGGWDERPAFFHFALVSKRRRKTEREREQCDGRLVKQTTRAEGHPAGLRNGRTGKSTNSAGGAPERARRDPAQGRRSYRQTRGGFRLCRSTACALVDGVFVVVVAARGGGGAGGAGDPVPGCGDVERNDRVVLPHCGPSGSVSTCVIPRVVPRQRSGRNDAGVFQGHQGHQGRVVFGYTH